jgi:predicted nucleotidyltransferase
MDDVAIAFWGSRTLPGLLFHLTGDPNVELTLGQLQTALGANRESLHRALQRALVTGVVTRRRVGSQYLYRADETSPFYPEVRSLCSKVLGPAGILAAAFSAASRPRVEQAFIYGSTARGTDHHASDIDVMVLGNATDFDLADILRDAIERIPRNVNPLVYTRHEIEEGMAHGNGFLLEVWVRPKMMLVGREEDLPQIPEARRR